MQQGVLDDVKQAREAAILGNYNNATVFYDGALSKLSQYVLIVFFFILYIQKKNLYLGVRE